MRVREGEISLSDGPFAETKEQLGGYYVVDVDTHAVAAKKRVGGEDPVLRGSSRSRSTTVVYSCGTGCRFRRATFMRKIKGPAEARA